MWLFYYPVATHYRLSDVIGAICLLAEQELRESGDDLTWCVQLRAEKQIRLITSLAVIWVYQTVIGIREWYKEKSSQDLT